MRTLATIHSIGVATLAVAIVVPAAAWAGGGSIKGKVEATPAKYLPETVVFLKKVPGTPPKKTVQIDQRNKTFVPNILALTVGDTVKFLNHDHMPHNVFSPECRYNLGQWGDGESKSYTFDKEQVCSQLCSLHPEMLAYVFVGQNPYSAVVGADGSFTIAGVPPGTYQIAVWNSHLKAPDQSVTVMEGGTASATFAVKRK